MKLLIADDEFYVRVSIREIMVGILTENDHIYEAENGIEMIKLVRSVQPDAVFLDIKMPKLDGLKAMEKLKLEFPSIQWVVISGYADFDYARQAVRLGAMDYLLKPVSPEQLQKTTDMIIKHIHALDQSRKDKQNRELSLYLNQASHTGIPSNDSPLRRYGFLPFVFIQSNQSERLDEQSLNRFLALLCKNTEYQEKDVFINVKTMPRNVTRIVFCWDKEKQQITEQMINMRCDDVKQAMKASDLMRAAFFGIIGKPCEIESLADQAVKMEPNLELGVLFRGETLLSRQEFMKWSGSSELLDLCCGVRRLQENYESKEYYRFMTASKEVLDLLEQYASHLTAAMEANLKSYLCLALGADANSTAIQWKEILRQGEKNLLLPIDGEQKSNLVGQVIKYIECNYEKDIGVAIVADKFHISPNYLSSLFHRVTGCTFVRYLTEVRIMNAKKLLCNPNIQVQEVAAAVGYENPKHFARLFKKSVGCYPSQFSEEIKE